MDQRFILICGAGAERQAALGTRLAASGLTVVRDPPGLLLALAPTLPWIDLGPAGAILGTLFAPGKAGPLAELRADTVATIASTGGDHLVRAYWGHYLAILTATEGTAVVRPPFGALPCFAHEGDGLIAVASQVALFEALDLYRRTIDVPALSRQLVAGEVRRAETCLSGVAELRGGDRWRVGDGQVITDTLWSPWAFAGRRLAIVDRREGDRRLRDQARYCVRELTTGFAKPLVLVSGGLDSSILVACLRHAERAFLCLTIATDNPTGDERPFARLVAAAVERPLVEGGYDMAAVDLGSSAARASPRPIARGFEQAADRLSDAIATANGCDAIIDGGGGDNVFASLQSATPAADCLLDSNGRAHFAATADAIAALAASSRWTVRWRAWRRSHRRDGFRWQRDHRFLTGAARLWASEMPLHPWLDAPAGILPGRAAHVTLLIAAQGLTEDGDRGQAVPTLSPLIAQPLVETVLRIPSWHWYDRHNNRAAARRAFSADLPAAIAWRRSKGTPDSLLVALFDRHRDWIRATLLDGWLVDRGLVDPDALRAVLDDPRPVYDHGFVRIMQLVDAEVWARAQG